MKTSELAKTEMNRLVNLFEKGEGLEIMARVAVIPDKGIPSAKWTLTNRMLAFAQTKNTDCRGFDQWRAVGRCVKKREKAAYIFRPCLVKDEEEEGKTKLIGFACLPVFSASQTDGEPLPYMGNKSELPLKEVAERFGLKIEYQPFFNGVLGFYQSSAAKIVMCTENEQVFFHELAHAAHNKLLNGKISDCPESKVEIIAELASCVLARFYGKQQEEGKSYNYIKSYAARIGRNLGMVLMALTREVGQVIELIIGTAEPTVEAVSQTNR